MRFFLLELSGTWAALVILSALAIPGGALFARLLRLPGFVEAGLARRAGVGLLCGFACLPVLCDLAGRLGSGAMTAAAVAMALAGVPALVKGAGPWTRVGPVWLAAALAWIVFAALCLVDLPDGAGGLSHSYLMIDHVKHAAVTWSIEDTGTPPGNPTFFEPGRKVAYYYFFYTLTAVASIVGGPLGVAARHAGFAGSILAGFALFALVFEVWSRSGADEACGGARPRASAAGWIVAILLTTGLDIIPALSSLYTRGGRLRDAPIESWDTDVTSWLGGALWVPHHVAGLCAAFVGFMALAGRSSADWRRVALASLAFASMAGLSVYVALGAALTAALWFAALLFARRPGDAARLALAGLGAGLIALPWLVTLIPVAGAQGPPPVAFGLRENFRMDYPDMAEPAAFLLWAARLFISMALEFGVFALGAWAFWRVAGRRGLRDDIAMVLVLSTIASVLLATFTRSTILNNDLAWRVMLFAQLATCVWTLAALRAGAIERLGLTAVARICLVLGYGATIFASVQLRWEPGQELPRGSVARATLPDQIAAWTWLSTRLPRNSVVQFRPTWERALSYGLYGHFPAAVSDLHNGRLFGPSEADVQARFEAIAPVFVDPAATLDDVRRIASNYRIAALVVTSRDPNFADPNSWVARTPASLSTAHARVFLLSELADAPR